MSSSTQSMAQTAMPPQFRFKSAVRFIDLFLITSALTAISLFSILLLFILVYIIDEGPRLDNIILILLWGIGIILFLTLVSCSIASAIAYPMYLLSYGVELLPGGIVMKKGFISYTIPYGNVLDISPEETRSYFKIFRLGRWSSGATTSKVVWLKLSSMEDLPLMTRFYSRNDNRVALDVNDPQGFLDAYMLMQQMRMQSFSMMTPMPFYMPKIPLMSERTRKGP